MKSDDVRWKELVEAMEEVLVSILVVVGHGKEEAEKGAAGFLVKIFQLAVAYLVAGEGRGDDEKTKKFFAVKKREDLEKYVGDFEDEKVEKALRDATEDVVGAYFDVVGKKLDADQRAKIGELVKSLEEAV